ncbi:MAG TPA: NifB/NifX family molybdenum-iron cluster-binding protein [Polyangia bacterium]|nr:NifB/NifX family molybdenum-iron cluster-binding protein [Polyangia bacterium]
MKIAIPVTQGVLSPHFGHCEQFALFTVDDTNKAIGDRQVLDAPPHEPGLLPRWLHGQGATVIIAGGMGGRAQGLFAEAGIQVVVGAPVGAPEAVARAFLDGTLEAGANFCDH